MLPFIDTLSDAFARLVGRTKNPLPSFERRRTSRLQVHERVRVCQPHDGAPWLTASVTDCSDTGLGLLCTENIPAGSTVLIGWRAGYFVGTVRNSRATGNVWRVGIELETLDAHKLLGLELRCTSAGLSIT